MSDCLCLCEHRRQVMVVARLHTGHLSCVNVFLVLQINGVVNRCQREVVEHLCRLHHQVFLAHADVLFRCFQFLHRHHSLTTFLHRVEVNHSRRLVLVIEERLHSHLGEECQRALRTHHRVSDDVERVVVSHQRAQVKACDILDGVFITYALGEFLVCSHAVAQVFNLLNKLRM